MTAKPARRRARAAAYGGVLGASVCAMLVGLTAGAGAASASALSVTPYGGFNPLLARAPYVTDLTQTTAYVNWATTSQTPGSIKVAPTVNGVCPASTAQWDTSAIPVPTSLPGPVNPVNSAGSASMTGWAYSFTDGSGVKVSEYQAAVHVTGLTAGVQYCYAVFSTAKAGAVDLLPPGQPTGSFTTLDDVSSTASLTFAVMADTGENYWKTWSGGALAFPGGVNGYQAALYSSVGQSGARFLLLGGDIAYSGGTQGNYGDLTHTGTQPEVSTVFGSSYLPLANGIPVYAASGNHGQNVVSLRSWPNPDSAGASGGTFALDSYSGVDGITGNFPDNWYAFSSGNVRIYMLDAAWADSATGTATGSLCSSPSACARYQADYDEHWQPNSPEYRWLAADLAAHPGGVKFAVFHFPLRSDNNTQPSDPYLLNDPVNPNAATSLEALLASNGVRFTFSGHAHIYQRYVPRQSGQVISYVVGGGGSVLEPVQGGTTCKNLLANADVYAIGYSPSSTTVGAGNGSYCGPAVNQGSTALAAATPTSPEQVYSYALVTVSGTSVRVRGVNAAGAVFDDQTYTVAGP